MRDLAFVVRSEAAPPRSKLTAKRCDARIEAEWGRNTDAPAATELPITLHFINPPLQFQLGSHLATTRAPQEIVSLIPITDR